MAKERSIIHVHLDQPYLGEKDWYFGSVSAIYDTIPTEVIGVKAKSTWGRFKGNIYRSRFATIKRGTLHTKKSKRGRF